MSAFRNSRPSRLGHLCLLVLTSACAEPVLRPAGADLRTTTSSLDLGDVFVGGVGESTVVVINPGRVDVAVDATAEAPFELERASFAVFAGAESLVRVRVRPTSAGRVMGTLRLLSAGSIPLTVDLWASGIEPLPCPPNSCQRDWRFNPSTGACVGSPEPDGSPCDDPCVSDGACYAGVCVGAFSSCDDGNACTVDACDRTTGACAWSPRTCAAPADPCKAAVCDPVLGCNEVEVADGTDCGHRDCVTAHVCIAGRCVAAPVAEGSRCGEGTPCALGGTCRFGACVQEAGRGLPEWEWRPPHGRLAGLLADAHGNVLVSDFKLSTSVAEELHLTSLTWEGKLRFRRPMSISGGHWGPQLGHVQDGVVTVFSLSQLHAYDVDTGQNIFARDLIADLGPQFFVHPAGCESHGSSLGIEATAFAAPGVMRVKVRVRGGTGCEALPGMSDTWLLHLDSRTGAFLGMIRFGNGSGPVVDETGRIFTTLGYPNHVLVGMSPSGSVLWNRSGAHATFPPHVLAASHGRVLAMEFVDSVWRRTRLFDASTGSVIGTEWSIPHAEAGSISADGRVFMLGTASQPACGSWWGAALYGMRPPTEPGREWCHKLTDKSWNWTAGPMVTNRGTVLLASGARDTRYASTTHDNRLREVSFDGQLRLDCPLALEHGLYGSVLTAGRLIGITDWYIDQRIVAFGLGDRSSSASGWVAPEGSSFPP